MQQQQQPPGHRRLPSRARGNRVHSELYPIPVVDEELGDILVGIGDAEASWDHIRKAIGEYCTQCIDHDTGRRVGWFYDLELEIGYDVVVLVLVNSSGSKRATRVPGCARTLPDITRVAPPVVAMLHDVMQRGRPVDFRVQVETVVSHRIDRLRHKYTLSERFYSVIEGSSCAWDGRCLKDIKCKTFTNNDEQASSVQVSRELLGRVVTHGTADATHEWMQVTPFEDIIDTCCRTGVLPFGCSDPFHVIESDAHCHRVKLIWSIDFPYFCVDVRLECTANRGTWDPNQTNDEFSAFIRRIQAFDESVLWCMKGDYSAHDLLAIVSNQVDTGTAKWRIELEAIHPTVARGCT